MADQTFGELLLLAREHRKWTRGVLSKKTRYGLTHLRDLETGTRPPPQVEQVLALCEVLDCNPVPMLHASIKQRGCVDLDVRPERGDMVAFVSTLALVWTRIDDATLRSMHQLAAVRLG